MQGIALITKKVTQASTPKIVRLATQRRPDQTQPAPAFLYSNRGQSAPAMKNATPGRAKEANVAKKVSTGMRASPAQTIKESAPLAA